MRARKNLANYVNNILIYSKNTDLTLIKIKQVLLTYEYINVELRRDLFRSSKTSIISSLINELRL